MCTGYVFTSNELELVFNTFLGLQGTLQLCIMAFRPQLRIACSMLHDICGVIPRGASP